MVISLLLEPVNGCVLSYNYRHSVYSLITSICNDKHNDESGKFTSCLDFKMGADKNARVNRFGNDGIKILNTDRPILSISSHDDGFIKKISENISHRKVYRIGSFNFTISDKTLKSNNYDKKKTYLLRTKTPIVLRDIFNNSVMIEDERYEEMFIKSIHRKLKQYISEEKLDTEYEMNVMLFKDGAKKKAVELVRKHYIGYEMSFSIQISNSLLFKKLIESGFGFCTQFSLGYVEIKK